MARGAMIAGTRPGGATGRLPALGRGEPRVPKRAVAGARRVEIEEGPEVGSAAAVAGGGFEVWRMWRSSPVRRGRASGRWAMIRTGVASGDGFVVVRGTAIG